MNITGAEMESEAVMRKSSNKGRRYPKEKAPGVRKKVHIQEVLSYRGKEVRERIEI